MSVLYKENNLFFIDHKEFITNLYQNVNETKESFMITGKIFSIRKNTEKLCNSKKRKRNSCQTLAEVSKKFTAIIFMVLMCFHNIYFYLIINLTRK